MVFHFAARGGGQKSRLVLEDFRALLDEKVSHSVHPCLARRALMNLPCVIAVDASSIARAPIGAGGDHVGVPHRRVQGVWVLPRRDRRRSRSVCGIVSPLRAS